MIPLRLISPGAARLRSSCHPSCLSSLTPPWTAYPDIVGVPPGRSPSWGGGSWSRISSERHPPPRIRNAMIRSEAGRFGHCAMVSSVIVVVVLLVGDLLLPLMPPSLPPPLSSNFDSAVTPNSWANGRRRTLILQSSRCPPHFCLLSPGRFPRPFSPIADGTSAFAKLVVIPTVAPTSSLDTSLLPSTLATFPLARHRRVVLLSAMFNHAPPCCRPRRARHPPCLLRKRQQRRPFRRRPRPPSCPMLCRWRWQHHVLCAAGGDARALFFSVASTAAARLSARVISTAPATEGVPDVADLAADSLATTAGPQSLWSEACLASHPPPQSSLPRLLLSGIGHDLAGLGPAVLHLSLGHTLLTVAFLGHGSGIVIVLPTPASAMTLPSLLNLGPWPR